jgi:hypothetical protein
MTRKRKFVYAAGAVLLLLGGLELFCRYRLGLGDPPLSRTDPEIEYLFVGPRTYHRFGNSIVYNTFSMRTHDFDARRRNPDEIRVLACGDSVINGGALTDQSQLMTTRLENHLSQDFHRPAVVMNVSAGSWGPPNFLAYVKRYGFFEADLLIIVVSSHDWADAPTWEPVVGVNSDFPDRTPTFALTEAVTRYLPRYLPHGGASAPPARSPSQGEIDQAMGAFKTLVRMAQDKHIPVLVEQHFEQPELTAAETEGHRAFREAIAELHVPNVEDAEPFAAEIKAGQTPYRDNIHLNPHGQEVLEGILYPEVHKALQK